MLDGFDHRIYVYGDFNERIRHGRWKPSKRVYSPNTQLRFAQKLQQNTRRERINDINRVIKYLTQARMD